MKALRVAQFLAHYPGREGTSAYATGLAQAMERVWPGSCPIISFRSDGRKPPAGVEVLQYPKQGGSPFTLPRSLVGSLDSNAPDAFVLHGTYNPPNVALARELRRRGIPYFFMPHDPYVPALTRHRALRKWVYWHGFEKMLISRARAVELLDDQHEQPLRALGINTPVFVVPNGCDPSALSEPGLKPVVPGSSMRVRVQYLGRMDRNHKGLDLLIEGFAQFVTSGRAQADSFDLVLTGNDWEDREFLERLASKRGVADRVRFTGPRAESSLQIQGEADLVILPSRFDGFGLTIMEAMLAARPVLVSEQAGVSTHVVRAGGGWTFAPEPGAIESALAGAAACRSDWEAMGKKNQEYVLRELTWEQVARKTMEGYQGFLKV